jgi:serine protease Do
MRLLKNGSKFTAFMLACIISGIIGGYAALNITAAVDHKLNIDKQQLNWATELSKSIVNISSEVSPSIVGISSKKEITGRNSTDQPTEVEYGTGTGIIIDKEGYILTNNHVIEEADIVTIILFDGKESNASIIGKDSRTDLAVLKIDGLELEAADMGDSSLILPGELVFAIGNPLGLELAGSITMGIISGIGRTLTVDGKRLNLFQTDAAINPGNSGGPLVNLDGEVIGINTLKEVYAETVVGIPIAVEGVGFAIPVNEAKPIIDDLIVQGYVTRPGIGAVVIETTQQIGKAEGMPQGVLVSMVSKGGAADKAGIMEGDIIIGFEENIIETIQDLLENINEYSIGDIIQMTVWREGEELVLSVQLEQLPE